MRRSLADSVPLAVATARFRLLLRAQGVAGRGASCEGMLPVVHGRGRVEIGPGLAVRSRIARAEFGATAGGVLRLGARAFLNQGSSIVAAVGIDVGDDFRLGDLAAVLDSDHHPVEEGSAVQCAPVRIGDDVWIGRGALVLPGCSIGDHAVVAAGSVVTGPVEARTLVAGVPARPVRTLRASAGWRRG